MTEMSCTIQAAFILIRLHVWVCCFQQDQN
jgi:hypothetical protein